MSKSESKYGLFGLDSELLESFWEEDDKHALIKALCLAECDFSAKCDNGFMVCRVDYQSIPFRTVANVNNRTAL